MSQVTPGIRLRLRGEDFLVTKCEGNIIDADGVSQLVYGSKFQFDLRLEEYDIIAPEHTKLQADTSRNYRQTKLFLETVFRNSSHYSESVEIADKAAIRASNYQFVPTLKALKQPQPRILIADAVGLGKTVQVGVFLTELIRRGKGKKVLVVTPKSILAQFQQEIWSRFAIPLVRLDSVGIAKIKSEIPSNKNPFDYYDKVIVSIDTLKQNSKFRHYLEKVKWDIVAIDECHNVANVKSQRGGLAKFLSERTEALVLTSATPHNGSKENFGNLIGMLDPTAVPADGDFKKEDIAYLYERRFKKDIENEVGDAFQDQVVKTIESPLSTDEEEILGLIQNYKQEAREASAGDATFGALLFSVGLFKAYMSSPRACLETVEQRLKKGTDEGTVLELLEGLRDKITSVLNQKEDSKYNALHDHLTSHKWSGRSKDDRIIIFAERKATLEELKNNFIRDFGMKEEAIVYFHGGLTDTEQQDILDDFSKQDSKIRLFLTSDAGSQGVNLHYHCHIMFNYDVPWSIITLDQRNGRIDRFGQTKTPEIFYLFSQSSREEVQGDIRILEKLKEKAEEVNKSIGDSGNVFKLFNKEAEENLFNKAVANSDGSIIDNAAEDEEEDPWAEYDTDSEVSEEVNDKKEISYDAGFHSFYNSEYNYYADLVDEISANDTSIHDQFRKYDDDNIIEIVQGGDLTGEGVLYDIPSEAFPKKKEVFKLTTDKEIVEQAIVESRKKQNTWPSHQLLYDLHPIANWMQNKLLSQVNRGNALVVKMRNPLPEKSAWFVFQGVTSNGRGKPVFSKSFVIGKGLNGDDRGGLDDFTSFMDQYHLKDTLPDRAISDKEINSLEGLLPEAVKSAQKMYVHSLQGDLEDDLEDKLEFYEKRLSNWIQDSERQMELKLEETNTFAVKSKDKRKQELNYVRENLDQFYKQFFQLENAPFIRLLAVFFNA